MDGLMQNKRNSSALAMELHIFYIEPSIYAYKLGCHWFKSHYLIQCLVIVNWASMDKLLIEIWIKIRSLSFKKMYVKCCLQNGGHFVLT